MLRVIIVSALLVGVITGLFLTAVQQLQVTPLILQAETFETSGSTEHSHAAASHSLEHSHQVGKAEPVDIFSQRFLLSLVSNIFAAMAFAFLTVAVISYSRQTGWAKGLLWGLAGFAVFFVAPSLGLYPELPGTSSAPLVERQIWWIATTVLTAAGIAMLVFSPKTLFKGVGVIFLITPHIVGAPQPEQVFSTAPQSMVKDFIIATTIMNAVFWLVLGSLSGYVLYKFDKNSAE